MTFSGSYFNFLISSRVLKNLIFIQSPWKAQIKEEESTAFSKINSKKIFSCLWSFWKSSKNFENFLNFSIMVNHIFWSRLKYVSRINIIGRTGCYLKWRLSKSFEEKFNWRKHLRPSKIPKIASRIGISYGNAQAIITDELGYCKVSATWARRLLIDKYRQQRF